MARQAGEAFAEIVRYAEHNAEQVRSIAAAAEEQSASATEINRSVEDVTKVAVEIADGMHDSVQAIEDLAGQAMDLGRLIEDMRNDTGDKLISWHSDLSVGIKEIDTQHMKLVDLINDLYAGMKAGKAHSAIGQLLDRLAEYTVFHFGHEEKLFDQYGYPESDSHKVAHKKLTGSVLDFIANFKAGKATVSNELMDFLRDWLIKHIKGTDKRYGPFFNQKGVR